MGDTRSGRARFVRWVTILAGAGFAIFGVWAYAAPASFYDTLATFEPFNTHFVRDIGAFQIGLGAVLLLSLLRTSTASVVLGGTGIAAALHAAGHVIDRDLGGSPTSDIPTFAVLAVALLVAAWLARGAPQAEVTRPGEGLR